MRYLFLIAALCFANVCFAGFFTPVVTGVSPNAGPPGGGTVVTVTGVNFSGTNSVHFGATTATSFTVNNDSQITATAPAGAPGAVDVTVTNPAGTSAITQADQYTYMVTPVRLQDFQVK
jgi:hypothetical protein